MASILHGDFAVVILAFTLAGRVHGDFAVVRPTTHTSASVPRRFLPLQKRLVGRTALVKRRKRDEDEKLKWNKMKH